MAVKFLNGIDVDGSMNIAASDVPNLDASKITSGTLSADRIPNLSGTYQPAGDYLTLETAETSFQPIGNYLTQTDGDARYLQTYDGLQSSHVTGALGYIPYQEGTTLSANTIILANIEKDSINQDGELGWDLNDSAAPASLGTFTGSYPDGLYFNGTSNVYTVYHTGHFSGTNIANWQTAYGWGNHASVGYLTSLPSHNHDTLYDAIGSSDAVNARIDNEIFPALDDLGNAIPTNNNQLTNGAGYITDLPDAGVGAGTYGSTSNQVKIDTITVDAKGRVTAVATGTGGDITTVRLVDDSGSYVQDTGGTAVLTIAGGEGISTSASGTTITITNDWGNHASAGYLTSIPSSYATDAEVNTAVGKVNARIDEEVFPALNDLGNAIPTNNNQLTNGAGYITGVNWQSIGAGTRKNYDLKFQPATTGGYAGFEFTKHDGNYAGYLLVKGTTSNDVYTANGITLVADGGWLTLAQRTSSAGVRIMTGSTSTERLIVRNDGSVAINPTSAWNSTNAALTVGSGGDGRIQTRHIWGKNSVDDTPDDLWLNYANAGKHVQIGQNGGGNNLYVAGDIYMNGYFTGNKVATESYVNTAVSNLVDSAPGALNTLNELAAALGDDANFSTTITNQVAAVDERINAEVFPALDDLGNSIPTNNNQLTNGAGYITAVPSSFSANSITIGGGATLTESTDRADLLMIKSSTSTWGGLQIANTSNEVIFSLMGDNNTLGLYDDLNNDWILQRDENGATRLYHNAGSKLSTTSTGISVTGEITTTGGNSTNWNTAYGWGNHASAGYLTSIPSSYATDAEVSSAVAAIEASINERIETEVLPAIDSKLDSTAKAADSNLLDGINSSQFLRSDANDTKTGDTTFTGKVTLQTNLVITEDAPTISFLDTTSGADDFYIHVNSNNFYVLRDTAGSNTVDGGWDSPHPMQLEGDTNRVYFFGNRVLSAAYQESSAFATSAQGTKADTAHGWGNHASAGYLKSIPATYVQQTQDIVSGNIHPVGDREQLLGLDSNRWQVVFCEILDSAGQHEKNLQNPEGEKSVGEYETGTVLVWKDGKNIPCTEPADHMRMGIAVQGVASPLIQGAEPVLVTGTVNEGDYLVTSSVEGHAKAISPQFMRQHGLYDCVLGKALENGEGESYLLKTWINI